MKRFYKQASVEPVSDGFTIRLDDRPVKTPERKALILPNSVLAEAIAAEWQGQGEEIDPRNMRLTGMANAAIDRIMPDRAVFVDAIAAYGETDTLCYRAEPGDALASQQEVVWEPILQWAETRYDIHLIRVAGIVHRGQPRRSLSVLRDAVAIQNPFSLAAMSIMVSTSGSLVAILALQQSAFGADVIWDAVCLEELWQEELWGSDREAQEKRALKRAEFDDAVKFCHLVGD
jgi:chaperone required for assembly of F1-ATPase